MNKSRKSVYDNILSSQLYMYKGVLGRLKLKEIIKICLDRSISKIPPCDVTNVDIFIDGGYKQADPDKPPIMD